MNTHSHKKFAPIAFAIATMLVFASPLFAYPPDNAAVLYYRASVTYDANYPMMSKVTQLIKGEIGIDDEIRAYVQSNRRAIKQYVDAGESPHCDWGLDYSQGLDLLMPEYASLRNLGRIVLAKAIMASESGDYAQALNLCLSVHKAGLHIANDGIIISHLVGISLNASTNQCLAEILPHISEDQQALVWLRGQIFEISGKLTPLKAAVNMDLSVSGQDIRRERAGYIVELCGEDISEESAQIIKEGDDAFFDASREYFMEYLSDVLTAIDLPYPQSYKQLVKLAGQPSLDKKTNLHAILSDVFAPAIGKILCLDVRNRTHFNAVNTALNLYITKARTGKLPDELPNDMPKDLFSGKDFKYEKKKGSFVLGCQGKDLSKDKAYEYEFKVK